MFTIDQHIEFLLLNHDCVIAPGFGGFVVHQTPASFDEAEGMMLPPSTTVGFNPDLTINDSLLTQSFVEAYDMSYPEAQREVESEIEELKALIADHGSYEINSVGTLSINSEGNYEFEPNKAGLLSTQLYALGPVDLKDPFTFIQPEKSRLKDWGATSAIMGETKNIGEKVIKISTSTIKKAAVACMCLCVLASIPFIGSQPGTKKVLEQVHASIFSMFIPNDSSKSENSVQTPKETKHIYVVKKTTQAVAETNGSETSAPIAKNDAPKQAQLAANEAKAAKNDAKPKEELKVTVYTIVLASQITAKNGEAFVNELTARGIKNVKMIGEGLGRKVIAGSYNNEAEAQSVRRTICQQEGLSQAWVLKINI